MTLRFSLIGFCASLLGVAGTPTVAAQTQDAPQMVLQLGHAASEGINVVTFSPDGKILASASDDGTVKLWDAASGGVLRSLEGGQGRIFGLAFAPDGTEIATGGTVGPLQIWSRSGVLLRSLPLPPKPLRNGLLSLRYSGRGQLVGLTLLGQFCVWNPAGQTAPRTFSVPPNMTSDFELTPDGTRLVQGNEDGTVGILDLETGRKVAGIEVSTSAVNSVAVSPDGKTLAVGGKDGLVERFDFPSGKKRGSPLRSGSTVSKLAFSSNGAQLACISEPGNLTFWNCATGAKIRSIICMSSDQAPTALAFSPTGRTAATGELWGGVNILDAAIWKRNRRLPTAQSPNAASVATSSDGRWIAVGSQVVGSGGASGAVQLWDARTGRLVTTLRGHRQLVDKVAFSPDGKHLVSYCERELFSWSVPEGRQLWKKSDDGAQRIRAGLFVTGSTVTLADPGTMELRRWNLLTGKPLAALKLITGIPAPKPGPSDDQMASPLGQPLGVEMTDALCLAADGSVQVLSEKSDHKTLTILLRAFDGKTGRLRRTTVVQSVPFASALGAKMIEFSRQTFIPLHAFGIAPRPGSAQVGIALMDQFQIRDAATGKLIHTLVSSDASNGDFVEFEFSSHGDSIATGRGQLWNISTGKSQSFPAARVAQMAFRSIAFTRAAEDGPDRFVALDFSHGTITLTDVVSGARLFTMTDFGPAKGQTTGDRWLSVTPDGHYSGSPGIEKMFLWRVGDELFPAEKFAGTMRRKP